MALELYKALDLYIIKLKVFIKALNKEIYTKDYLILIK
jgi:hypothetical protein